MVQRRNAMPPPLFILCPLRSYSSVACAMLGQHPNLYAMPELNLFLGDTIEEMSQAVLKRMPAHGRDGLLRAVGQLLMGGQEAQHIDDARQWLDEHGEWRTRRVLRRLRQAVGNRVLIDKSPATVMQPEFLEAMRSSAPRARYLHLARHPSTFGDSLYAFLKRSSQWGRQIDPDSVDAERLWLRAQVNIMEFTAEVPEDQVMLVRGEDLLREPDLVLSDIVEWLGYSSSVDDLEAMLHPEDSPYACNGPENARGGNDPGFLDNPELDLERLERIRIPPMSDSPDWDPERKFSRATLAVARALGYE